MTELTDDLDNSAAERSWAFSFDGSNFEIDLSKRNGKAFEKVLRPYIDGARKVRAVRGRSAAAKSTMKSATRTDLTHTVNARGRVPADVVAAYDAAN